MKLALIGKYGVVGFGEFEVHLCPHFFKPTTQPPNREKQEWNKERKRGKIGAKRHKSSFKCKILTLFSLVS